MTGGFLVAAVFLACAVESVEALTIVLAAGVSRGWRSALTGTAAALALLAVLVAALGPALAVIPLRVVRLVVGGLLLSFGLQWLRKAVLRAAGARARHDEDAAYAAQLSAAGRPTDPGRWDGAGFALAFKGTLLEGLEVVFIVLTFGRNQGSILLASLGAAAAVLLVGLLGLAVRRPLARLPENTVKFAVGVLLTGFGTFWGGEGAGARWPHGELSLPVLLALVAVAAVALVRLARRRAVGRPPAVAGERVLVGR